ncbi:MAG: CPBP family intramembrane metalloprotease [Lachnospiraceae bacterium]|nr:CPBP family intramembrane metalloprotease [Lachnospiraceae bacterium]
MNEINEKYLRPCRKTTDQFIIAAVLGSLLIFAGGIIVPAGLLVGPFEKILGGDHDAAVFLLQYFSFLGVWIVFFLAAVIFKGNRPMLQAVKYCSPRAKGGADDAADRKANRAGNNLRGLLIGLALGFGCNGFCILMSVLLGDIHIEYSGFEPLPFILFFICVFIQSAAEELADRWYLYQKLRRRYKAPWVAIVVNSLVFMALHMLNPGISLLALFQIFLVGTIFSLLVYYYNGLWIAAAFHAAWNFTQSIFFGLPNSGVVSAYSVFRLDAASAKNGLFYNVNFGVEGSAGAAAVLIAVGAAIVLKNRGKAEHTDIWAKAEQAALKARE